jgi:hypothetical protein
MWTKSFCNQPAVAKKKKKFEVWATTQKGSACGGVEGSNNGRVAGSRYYVTLVRGTDTSRGKSGTFSVSDQSPVRCWVTISQTTSLSLLELPREIEGHVADCGITTEELSAYPIFISVV